MFVRELKIPIHYHSKVNVVIDGALRDWDSRGFERKSIGNMRKFISTLLIFIRNFFFSDQFINGKHKGLFTRLISKNSCEPKIIYKKIEIKLNLNILSDCHKIHNFFCVVNPLDKCYDADEPNHSIYANSIHFICWSQQIFHSMLYRIFAFPFRWTTKHVLEIV